MEPRFLTSVINVAFVKPRLKTSAPYNIVTFNIIAKLLNNYNNAKCFRLFLPHIISKSARVYYVIFSSSFSHIV